jgi:hypothetical protein
MKTENSNRNFITDSYEKDSNPDKPVDVFYLYPTVWAPDSATNTLYCSIDNPSMLAGSVSAFNRQATYAGRKVRVENRE